MLVVVGIVMSLVAAARVPQAEAAVPGAGTIGPGNLSTSWTGQTYPAMSTPDPKACPPASDPGNLRCDHFFLTVDVPSSYWSSHNGGARVRIEWPNSSNDFDLYIYDSSGGLVTSSAQGGTTFEEVFIYAASGTYEVRVVPFLVIVSSYSGKATFESQAGQPQNGPARPSGGITFAPATVIDAQRTEGEPINFIDANGNYWESGPYGTSTQLSFIHRSTDSGDQFNIIGVAGTRPDLPPGGGDTDIAVDDQGVAYFVDLEGLINLGCSVSNDDGNTWRKTVACVTTTLDDRQWFAVDNGLTAAASDNTIFLGYREELGTHIYSTPGSTGTADPVGGLVYSNSTDTLLPLNEDIRCGKLIFDPVQRYLYYPCGQQTGTRASVTVGHVNPGQRTGIQYHNVLTPASPGGGQTWSLFPVVATDRAGNLYAVWVDSNDRNVYLTASTDHGDHWGPVIRVNGNDANTTVMPWIVGGANGSVAIGWYGNNTHLTSDQMPSWYTSRQAATAFKWFGYTAVVRNALSATPTIYQARFTEKPMHYGQICTGGLGCTLTGGDRTMADFFAISLDRDGAMRIVYNDTTSQHHGAHLFEARQIAGVSPLNATVGHAAPSNPMSDATGDAHWPHYQAVVGPGPNQTRFDFTRLAISQPDAATLRVRMTVANLDSFLPPAGTTSALWLTRFQALSRGDHGEEAYRIFYLGAESTAGGSPTFFAGSGATAEGAIPGNGCTTTTPENCKIVQYPRETAATGSISGNTITIDVPLQGFGPGRPIFGSTLYSATALSGGRRNTASADLYADVDATRAFDYTLGSAIIRPPRCDPDRDAEGSGEVDDNGKNGGNFSFNGCDEDNGKVRHKDDGGGEDFRSTRVDDVKFDAASHKATITGAGVSRGQLTRFTLVVVDGSSIGAPSTYSLSLADGYARTGVVRTGAIRVR
jgi:hypothetical protein